MTKSNWNFFIFYFLICFISIALAKLDLSGENVCSKASRDSFIKLKDKCAEKSGIYTKFKCLIDLDFNKLTDVFCCPGYEEIDDRCVPECDDCVHGTCIAPNICEDCSLGFGGENCAKACNSTDRFGKNCENYCKVILNPKLNNNFEFCESCNSTNYIRKACKDICKCRHVCSPGFYGKDCNLKCPSFKYGHLCSNDCKCVKNNTSTCNRISGECKCMDSYYGEYCELWCDQKISELVCTNSHNCTCEFKLEYKFEKLKIEKQNLENSYFDKSNLLIKFGIGLSIMIILVILSILYKYKFNQKIKLNSIKFVNNKDEKKASIDILDVNDNL